MSTLTPPTAEQVLRGVPAQMLINGEWCDSATGETFEKLNPANETVLATLPSGGTADIDAAVRAARAQFDGGEWSKMPAPARAALLYRLAELIDRDARRIAELQVYESGQPIHEPLMLDLPQAAETFRYYAGWCDKITGTVLPVPSVLGQPAHAYTIREPVGVVGAIIPWNGPILIASWKVAPALAAGCTVVIKPAEDAMLTILSLGKLIEEAGFPPGVVNIVTGFGETAGAALASHPGVDKVSFTGSPEVGRIVLKLGADTIKRVTLELGGKTPQIIFPDANLDAALTVTAIGIFANQGQICAAGTRVLAHRSLYDEVVQRLGAAADSIVLGDPFDETTQMGTLINRKQFERVLSYIDIGQREGARLIAGGERARERGYYVRPTIFADASNDMRIAQEEIFGPVGTVIPFDDPAEAVRLANGTSYGLAATIWTRDVSRAHLLARELRAGAVWVNCWGIVDPRLPWGGAGRSGIGRELGWSGIEDCTEEKVVTIAL
jgi:acyl-CoA reductase-like NAD-dependent aldehyde dehydrogenase